jgi:hypothetical protein
MENDYQPCVPFPLTYPTRGHIVPRIQQGACHVSAHALRAGTTLALSPLAADPALAETRLELVFDICAF